MSPVQLTAVTRRLKVDQRMKYMTYFLLKRRFTAMGILEGGEGGRGRREVREGGEGGR